MRVVREIAHPDFKITVFSWNNRYLIKLEQGVLEQTFKLSETDILSEEDLFTLLDAEFLQQANERFTEMGRSLHEAAKRSGF